METSYTYLTTEELAARIKYDCSGQVFLATAF